MESSHPWGSWWNGSFYPTSNEKYDGNVWDVYIWSPCEEACSSQGYFPSAVHYKAYHVFSIVASSFLLDIPDKNGPCSSPMYLLVCARDKLAAESVVMEIKLQMNNVFIMCESSPLSLKPSTVWPSRRNQHRHHPNLHHLKGKGKAKKKTDSFEN